MKRQSFPLWLLRDVPALVGFLASFWALIIFVMASGSRRMRDGHFALLLAHAEAKLDLALWRQAYRRLGWPPSLVQLHIIPPTILWADTFERLTNYGHAFRNMNRVVDSYVDELRARYGIAKREAASASSHAPVRTPLATFTKSSLADRRGRWIAAPSRRDGGGCMRTCARGPPRSQNSGNPAFPTRSSLRERARMRAA